MKPSFLQEHVRKHRERGDIPILGADLDTEPNKKPEPFKIASPKIQTVKVPSKSKKKDKGGRKMENEYECADCGESLKKGWKRCPNCGAELDWSGIQ